MNEDYKMMKPFNDVEEIPEKTLDEIVAEVAEEEGMTKEDVRKMYDAYLQELREHSGTKKKKNKGKAKAKRKQAKKSRKKNR